MVNLMNYLWRNKFLRMHLICIPLLSWPVLLWGEQLDDTQLLIKEYEELNKSEKADLSLPFRIHSQQQNGRLSAEVFSQIDQPFGKVAQALREVTNWCEFMPLNLNIKACVFKRQSEADQLTLYVGRKYYQTPQQSHELSYQFQANQSNKQELKVALHAAEGPMGTSDYMIELDGIENEGQTLLRVKIAYSDSWMSKLARSTYVATLGRNKLGFSVVGMDAAGQPIYNRGNEAVIERNVMRYLLAMQAYLETLAVPVSIRMAERSERWFDLTEQYAEQLHELDREEYLNIKKREWLNQQQLQQDELLITVAK